MKNVIYFGTGIAFASVNMINAGCCGSNNEKKSISLSDVEISFMIAPDYKKVDCEKIDDDIKKDFARHSTMFKDMFRFADDDIASNVSIFNGVNEKGVSAYIFVGTDAIVDKQDTETKNQFIQKLGDSGLNVCCIARNLRLGPVAKGKVSIEADKDKKTKFNIKIR